VQNVDGLEVPIEGNKDGSSLAIETGSLVAVDIVAESVLFSVETIADDEGVLFPPPNSSTSSPITFVTHISGLFGFDVRVSLSPVLHGGLLGNEYEFEKEGSENCCCSLDKTLEGSDPPEADEDIEANAEACNANVAA
jgi:hypothetical protein